MNREPKYGPIVQMSHRPLLPYWLLLTTAAVAIIIAITALLGRM